jgi:8-oxo-dGTP pyrophosphatase MutT (NUDIX family)
MVTWDQVRRALAGYAPRRVDGAAGPVAAVALVLREAPAGGPGGPLEALFIRRAEHPRDPWSGQIGLPGGRAEDHDEDAAATAVRETAEETGLDLRAHGEVLGALDELQAMARLRARDLVIKPFVFRLCAAVEARASDEVADVHWLPLDPLLAPEARGLLDYDWQGTTVRFPCLRLHGVVIWGLTFRMIAGFAERLVESA